MGNKISIEGNGNIVIQDLNNGTISINSSDTEALKKYFDKATSDIKEELLKVLSHLNIQISTNLKTDLPKHLTIEIPTLSKESIVGRSKELNDIHQMLFNNKMVVVMNGMGGIGKTTLAQVYIHEYCEEYHHIAWISHNFEDIILDFANAKGLVENLEIKKEISETQEIFSEICRKLKLIEKKPNLLIIDNADESIEKIRYSLPQQPNWHILITSRYELNGFSIKNLEFLSKEEALSLFKTHYLRNDLSDLQILELIDLIDYHTLTIEILAKTAMIQRYSFEKLNLVIIDNAKSNVKINRPGTDKIERITSFLCFIFNLSDLNENELWLLKQFVCLPPEFHNYKLLFDLISPEKSQKEEIFAETLELLMQNGWLQKNKDADSYKMHRIIAEVVKKQHPIGFGDVKNLTLSIISNLDIDQSIDNPIEKFKWVSFGDSILSAIQSCENIELIKLYESLGCLYKEMGIYQRAKKLFENGLQLCIKINGEEDQNTFVLKSDLASTIQILGDYKGAKELLEEVMQNALDNFGEDHPKVAICYSNLASVLNDLGDYENAKRLLEKALLSDEKNYGTNHPSTARCYSNLATVIQTLGELEQAKLLLEKSIESTKINLGEFHPTISINYSNLAIVLKDLGNYTGAKELLEKALTIDEKNYGVDHPSTNRTYSNLATVLQCLEDYKGAILLLEKAIKSNEMNFGPDHPATAIRYSNLASVLKDIGDLGKAKILLEKALEINIKNLGEEHPLTAKNYSNLASLLLSLFDFEKAKTLFEKAIAINEKIFGMEHPTTANNYSSFAILLKDIGEYSKAFEFSSKALQVFEKKLPTGHPSIEKEKEIVSKIKNLIS